MSAKRPSDRAFGLVFAGLFAAIAGVALAWTGSAPGWALALSAGLLLLALAAPGVLMPANRLWNRAGRRIGLVSNGVLLGGFYFGVVVPFGLAARALHLSTLRKRPDPTVETYWTAVVRQATPDTYPDLF